jgi:sterol 24-C-methyltransferase
MRMKSKNPVVNYYHTFESKLGYRWMEGIKHFGYYPEGQENLSKKAAQHLMNEQLAQTLNVPEGSVVLDAGCGEGGVALYLTKHHKLQVHGIDLLDFNLKRARANAQEAGVDPALFRQGDYTKLPYADNTFDGLYTMETFVHAPDYKQALAEFRRVLKPGGKLALFEYSNSARIRSQRHRSLRQVREINRLGSMPAFNEFEHGTYAPKLSAAGFSAVTETDITPRTMPMLKLFYDKARKPFAVIKKLHLQKHFVNTMSAVVFYENPGVWHYVVVAATNKK